jgi:DNA-binding response OmpR family regulator
MTTSCCEKAQEIGDYRRAVLLVTDDEYSGPLLQSILERDNYRVTMTDSADDAIDILGDKQFHSVFIKDTVAGDYIDLIDRLRKFADQKS